MSRLRCSEGGFGLWLGDKGIVNGKTSTHLSYSNIMGILSLGKLTKRHLVSKVL
jgi:hypothetical protein